MSKSLVIVESPTKARTINRFLGRGTEVQASMGHVRDLPQRKFGVDIANNFEPLYQVTESGRKVLGKLRKAAADAGAIYLATDPDREGEAIAWHIEEVLKDHTQAAFHRVTFHEITQAAVNHAFAEPGALDANKVDAQQARRILDRLVGYKVSPLLWRHVQKGTSAGRVQSVALRLVCEREREVQAFTPVEYWNLTAHFRPAQAGLTFDARLFRLDGEKPNVPDASTANALAAELEAETTTFHVVDQKKKRRRKRPAPPFITSTLQQSAGGSLRFSAQQTMRVAQQLYEGVELGSGGPVGLITYMRTDSVNVAQEAQSAARSYIGATFGGDYVPERPNRFRSRQSAQGAHEAIRPTDVTRTPDAVARYLSRPQLRLYRLIWNRFVASQMAPAQLVEHTIDVAADEACNLQHGYLFRATATTTAFPGFMKVYREQQENGGQAEKVSAPDLPELRSGTPCGLEKLDKEQKFTEPPKRYSEATLVRELEAKGVGRPSTYATIVSTIQQRDYVKKDKGRLTPTPLGFSVNDYLVERVPQLFQVNFTAEMESQLDEIEEGKLDSTEMLDHFYAKFRAWVQDVEMVHVPDAQTIQRLLDLFPDDITWAEPTKRGRTTYDDAKFFASLRKQAEEKKRLSDKQWRALLTLAARYADQIPGLLDYARELGIETELQKLIKGDEQGGGEASRKLAAPEPDEETKAYIAALETVKNWEPPQKRGKRTYDDAKFFHSLRDQVTDGRALSTAQQRALQRLVLKYHEQIDGFDELRQRFGLQSADQHKREDAETVKPLLDLVNHIQEWAAPRKGRRGRTYDDREFVKSLGEQFESGKQLSVKQANALRKVLAKYHEQIPDYEEKRQQLGLPEPPRAKGEKREEVQTVDETCPECGKQLVVRRGRRGPFYGCSGYPKCRFTKPAPAGEKPPQGQKARE